MLHDDLAHPVGGLLLRLGEAEGVVQVESLDLVTDGVLQGAEDGYTGVRDGLGWTISISGESGQVVLTASGDQVAFVVFGAALPL